MKMKEGVTTIIPGTDELFLSINTPKRSAVYPVPNRHELRWSENKQHKNPGHVTPRLERGAGTGI